MKTILLSIIISAQIFASDFSATYDITMKMLGNIGQSTLVFDTDKKSYDIKMHIQMDKELSDTEHSYESHGIVADGEYLPEYYIKYVRKDDKEEISYYVFEHDAKIIHKYVTTIEDESALLSMFSSSNEKEITNVYEKLEDYSANDTLTTFLNAKALLGDKDEMKVESVGFRKDERIITLKKYEKEFRLSIEDKEDDDFFIMVSIAPDGLVKDLMIKEYTMLGNVSVRRLISE